MRPGRAAALLQMHGLRSYRGQTRATQISRLDAAQSELATTQELEHLSRRLVLLPRIVVIRARHFDLH